MNKNRRWILFGLGGLLIGMMSGVSTSGLAQTTTSDLLHQMEEAFNALDATQLILVYSQNAAVTRINNGRSYRGISEIRSQLTRDLSGFQQLSVRYGDAQAVSLSSSQVLLYAPFSVTGTSISGSSVHFNGASTFVLQSANGQWQILHEHSSAPFFP